MFEGSTLERVDVGDAKLRVRCGGSGLPVLLSHGHPRTHATWHKVVPVPASSSRPCAPNLQGYRGVVQAAHDASGSCFCV
jgi:haloacetate dehalogenase